MLAPLGYKPRLANNFMAVSIAYLMNIFIPKSGEVSRGIVLDKYEKIPFSAGFGTIRAGSRERSNVDLTNELVDLIAAQRNFQASAKAIETTTTLTQTIINIRM